MKERDLIWNPYFLSGLAVLILNDSILKWYFSNALTGKLSDFAGLFILPIFIAYILPKSKKHISLIIGILFILWKSPLSTPFIEFVNALTFLKFKRVIDFTDLIALSVVPLSHLLINKSSFQRIRQKGAIYYFKALTLAVSFFAFTATTMIRYEIPKGTVYIGKSYTVKMSKDSLLNKINELGYDWQCKTDSISSPDQYRPVRFYQIENVVIREDQYIIDTLKNIKFQLIELKRERTKIEVINVELNRPGSMQDWRQLKQLSRAYKEQVIEGFFKKVKE